jgi:hypothetical protein
MAVPDIDGMVKNADAFKGVVFVMVAEITQFDAATGKCAFRTRWDTAPRQYSYEYQGDNAVFTAADQMSGCPSLNGVDQNDVVRVWAEGAGAFSYATQIGGNTVVPSFTVLKVEVITKT